MASSYDRARRQQVDPNAASGRPSPDDLTSAEQFTPVKAPSDAHLASAEREWRRAVPDSFGDMQMPDLVSQWLMAEYDRRGLVEQAATTLVDVWDEQDGLCCNKHATPALRALAAAVHGETP